jgi:hypothetical protein
MSSSPIDPEGAEELRLGEDPGLGPAEFADGVQALAYALAGKAVLTLRSSRTGRHYTYKLTGTDPNSSVFFVSLRTGGEKKQQWSYIGMARTKAAAGQWGQTFWSTKGTTIPVEDPAFRGFRKAWDDLARGVLPKGIAVLHEGRCGRCGLPLTHPESLRTGLGPDCARRVKP